MLSAGDSLRKIGQTMPISVLLVDDNALFREGIAEILQKDGRFDVVGQASRGDEVVAAAARLQPN